MSSDFLSVDDAAIEMNVSRATAWKWIKRHGLQTYRFMGSRKTFVNREDLEKLKSPIPIMDHEKKRPPEVTGQPPEKPDTAGTVRAL